MIESICFENFRGLRNGLEVYCNTYFSVTDDFVSMKIGEAARANAFNWSTDKLVPLKKFILSATLQVEIFLVSK